jgi:hypothetical protein
VELKGSLRNFALPDIMQLIGSARRTGLLLITIGGNRASIFFEDGHIVHAEYRDLGGQAALNRLFPEQEGNFQFLADAEADARNFSSDWMSALMEAARVNDEAGQGGDGLDDLDALDLGAGGAAPAAARAPAKPAWDAAQVKSRIREALHKSFGKKASKIEQELEKCPDTKLGLLDFCTKAEKYIFVFLDSGRAKPVADQLRNIVEEPQG